jgi:hypothetical protein
VRVIEEAAHALDEIAGQVGKAFVERNARSTPLGIDIADAERGRRSFHNLLIPLLLRLDRCDELERRRRRLQ